MNKEKDELKQEPEGIFEEFEVPDESVFESSTSQGQGVQLVDLSAEQIEEIKKMSGDEVVARALIARESFQPVHTNAINYYRAGSPPKISEGHKTTLIAFLMGHPHTLNGVFDHETKSIMTQEEWEKMEIERKANMQEEQKIA